MLLRGGKVKRAPVVAAAAALASPITSSCAINSVIVDTDVGMDDVAALALLARLKVLVALITTTCGICLPGTGSFHVQRLVDALGMMPPPSVVGGAEDGRRVPHDEWEREQHVHLASLCGSLGTAAPKCAPPSADAAAEAILQVARAKTTGETLTMLALGSMSNVGAAARKDPEAFGRIDRIVFVGGVRTSTPGYHHQPYNAWIDPDGLRDTLRSRVPLLLVGHDCYPKLPWCDALMRELEGEEESVAASSPPTTSRRILRHIFRLDARQMAFDPVAVFYLAHPEAFTPTEPMRVRVTDGDSWRFEECAAADPADADGVIELEGVDFERYREWLTRALSDPATPNEHAS
jgi:inosine-uridine nucleoside N-ribohydrolase